MAESDPINDLKVIRAAFATGIRDMRNAAILLR
jgi:hypothetical protein